MNASLPASLKRKGVFRLKDAKALGLHSEQVRRLTRQGHLTRLGRGLYAHATAEPSEYHTLAEVAERVPKGVVCLLTALRFHGLGTQHPREVWLAVDRRAAIPKLDVAPVRIVRMSGAALTSGIEEHKVEGVTVRVTSPARTVVDCFKFRKSASMSPLKRSGTIVACGRARSMKLWRHADQLRMTRVLRPYWDAIAS